MPLYTLLRRHVIITPFFAIDAWCCCCWYYWCHYFCYAYYAIAERDWYYYFAAMFSLRLCRHIIDALMARHFHISSEDLIFIIIFREMLIWLFIIACAGCCPIHYYFSIRPYFHYFRCRDAIIIIFAYFDAIIIFLSLLLFFDIFADAIALLFTLSFSFDIYWWYDFFRLSLSIFTFYAHYFSPFLIDDYSAAFDISLRYYTIIRRYSFSLFSFFMLTLFSLSPLTLALLRHYTYVITDDDDDPLFSLIWCCFIILMLFFDFSITLFRCWLLFIISIPMIIDILRYVISAIWLFSPSDIYIRWYARYDKDIWWLWCLIRGCRYFSAMPLITLRRLSLMPDIIISIISLRYFCYYYFHFLLSLFSLIFADATILMRYWCCWFWLLTMHYAMFDAATIFRLILRYLYWWCCMRYASLILLFHYDDFHAISFRFRRFRCYFRFRHFIFIFMILRLLSPLSLIALISIIDFRCRFDIFFFFRYWYFLLILISFSMISAICFAIICHYYAAFSRLAAADISLLFSSLLFFFHYFSCYDLSTPLIFHFIAIISLFFMPRYFRLFSSLFSHILFFAYSYMIAYHYFHYYYFRRFDDADYFSLFFAIIFADYYFDYFHADTPLYIIDICFRRLLLIIFAYLIFLRAIDAPLMRILFRHFFFDAIIFWCFLHFFAVFFCLDFRLLLSFSMSLRFDYFDAADIDVYCRHTPSFDFSLTLFRWLFLSSLMLFLFDVIFIIFAADIISFAIFFSLFFMIMISLFISMPLIFFIIFFLLLPLFILFSFDWFHLWRWCRWYSADYMLFRHYDADADIFIRYFRRWYWWYFFIFLFRHFHYDISLLRYFAIFMLMLMMIILFSFFHYFSFWFIFRFRSFSLSIFFSISMLIFSFFWLYFLYFFIFALMIIIIFFFHDYFIFFRFFDDDSFHWYCLFLLMLFIYYFISIFFFSFRYYAFVDAADYAAMLDISPFRYYFIIFHTLFIFLSFSFIIVFIIFHAYFRFFLSFSIIFMFHYFFFFIISPFSLFFDYWLFQIFFFSLFRCRYFAADYFRLFCRLLAIFAFLFADFSILLIIFFFFFFRCWFLLLMLLFISMIFFSRCYVSYVLHYFVRCHDEDYWFCYYFITPHFLIRWYFSLLFSLTPFFATIFSCWYDAAYYDIIMPIMMRDMLLIWYAVILMIICW